MNDATLAYIRRHASDDVRQLALRPVPDGVVLRQALTQIEGRQLAARKLPAWAATDGLLFPPRLSLEQCSSEATAQYKQALVRRLLASLPPASSPSLPPASSPSLPSVSSPSLPSVSSSVPSPSLPPAAVAVASATVPPVCFVDLTAGFGVDFAAIAPLFARATYVERQEVLCDIARHNLPLLGLPEAEVRCSSAEEVLPELADNPVTLLFLDPARRDAAGRKVALIEDCTPDVCALQDQLRAAARFVLIKLSPMLDLTAALRSMQGVVEAHVVSVDGECKELLLLLAAEASAAEPLIHCSYSPTVPPLTFRMSEERSCSAVMAGDLQQYLYEPDAAILKAGAFKVLCQRYPVSKLAPDTHLYTSGEPVADFPGRRWKVIGSCSFAKSELRRLLADVPAADLTLRGFPGSVAQLRKQLHLREGGSAHFIATTLADGSRHLIRVEREAHPLPLL
ncbi:MAG: hypothetical protein IJ699_04160 [Bacteroidaceae bacterium]|nr:hypothetical protein [Bacteroidaceae bacterium]